jgi:hypothetical protein
MFGLFSEMGPWSLDEQLNLVPRPETWNIKYKMLFIDNPVGAGYSSPAIDEGYCTNTKECVASNLHSLLTQFYVVFPEVHAVDLYITGTCTRINAHAHVRTHNARIHPHAPTCTRAHAQVRATAATTCLRSALTSIGRTAPATRSTCDPLGERGAGSV